MSETITEVKTVTTKPTTENLLEVVKFFNGLKNERKLGFSRIESNGVLTDDELTLYNSAVAKLKELITDV